MHTSHTPLIGLISGVGPLAGADVYHKMLAYAATAYDAREDNEYPDILLLNHGISGVDNTAQLSEHFMNELVSMTSRLQSAGATIIGIACNTAHIYYDNLPQKTGSATIHLLDAVAAELDSSTDRALLLSSSTTKKLALYDRYLQIHAVEYQILPAGLQSIIDTVIQHVMAYQLPDSGHLLDTVLSYALQKGYTTIIAGCTELPLAFAQAKLSERFTVVDPNAILAHHLVDAYYQSCAAMETTG